MNSKRNQQWTLMQLDDRRRTFNMPDGNQTFSYIYFSLIQWNQYLNSSWDKICLMKMHLNYFQLFWRSNQLFSKLTTLWKIKGFFSEKNTLDNMKNQCTYLLPFWLALLSCGAQIGSCFRFYFIILWDICISKHWNNYNL